MLEALPALTSLVMVLAYLQSKKQKAKMGWLILSAIFLGLTAASKYLYCVVGIAVLVDWYLVSSLAPPARAGVRANEVSEATSPPWRRLLRRYAPRNDMLLWGLLAIAIFFAANPYLWPDPVGRLKESVFYHAGYTSGAAEVQQANFPIWQPLVWLNTSPNSWHEGVFLLAIDPLIALLAAFGLARLWKKERVYVLWLGIGLFFLLLWPTKWPQYIIMLTAPLSLAAAHGTMVLIVQPFQNWLAARKSKQAKVVVRTDVRQALPWLIPGLLAFAVFTLLPLIFQVGVSLTDFNSV
jgi:hypothetical protein